MRKITILNGDMESYNSPFSNYINDLTTKLNRKNTCKTFLLSEMNLKYCTGCFSCWWKIPGRCVINDDAEEIFKSVINSDLVIFASPLMTGFASSVLKKIMDRMIVLLHPYVVLINEECHHANRYDRYPKIGLILQKEKDTDGEDLNIIGTIFDRFAINFHSEVLFMEITGSQEPELLSLKIEDGWENVPVVGAEKIFKKYGLSTNIGQCNPDLRMNKKSVAFTNSNKQHLVIFNGSPRFKNSNSDVLIDAFLKGYYKNDSEETPIYYLAPQKNRQKNIAAFQKADIAILFFPLYTDCMPGIVKMFFEDISQLPDLSGKKFGFVVQSGFPELINSVFVERYLEKLVKRLKAEYLGTVIKGGVESLRFQPKNRSKKMLLKFNDLGAFFAKKGFFSPEIAKDFFKPYKLPLFYRFIFHIVLKTGLANSYWDKNLKENGAFEIRFDKPFK